MSNSILNIYVRSNVQIFINLKYTSNLEIYTWIQINILSEPDQYTLGSGSIFTRIRINIHSDPDQYTLGSGSLNVLGAGSTYTRIRIIKRTRIRINIHSDQDH